MGMQASKGERRERGGREEEIARKGVQTKELYYGQ